MKVEILQIVIMILMNKMNSCTKLILKPLL